MALQVLHTLDTLTWLGPGKGTGGQDGFIPFPRDLSDDPHWLTDDPIGYLVI